MRCPYCASAQVTVLAETAVDGGVARVQQCLACGKDFRTRELCEGVTLTVIGRDGRRGGFDRAKLARAITQACARRPISSEAINDVVDSLEAELSSRGAAEVSSRLIGEMVLAHLRDLDEVAYVRFASMYRAYRQAEDFAEEVLALKEWRRRSVESRLQLELNFEEDQPHWN